MTKYTNLGQKHTCILNDPHTWVYAEYYIRSFKKNAHFRETGNAGVVIGDCDSETDVYWIKIMVLFFWNTLHFGRIKSL